mgnify:CR=1 FL=1
MMIMMIIFFKENTNNLYSKLRIFTNGYRNKTNRALCTKMYINSKRTCIAKANLEFTGKIINMRSNYL